MLENLRQIWQRTTVPGRLGMMAALLLLVGGVTYAGWALLRPDYRVLFTGLDPQDASTLVSELDRMKVPYRIGSDESTLLVDSSQVHATRLKLMGKGINLHGAVGFEIFNGTDFGMTEFAQKINYQRALQGELTRTIMALDEVKAARVHLVMAESGLFKKSGAHPKASIALTLAPGRTLRPEQVVGIQRLVAAAVPEIAPAAVMVLDQRGVALTRSAESDSDEAMPAAGLEIKNEIETYFSRKAMAVLDRAFGTNRATVSVDVTINYDQVKITKEDVIPSGQHGTEATGIVTRKRVTENSRGNPSVVAGASDAPRGGSSSMETEYQNGRRVEQLISRPGSIRRLSVGVLLPTALDAPRLEELKQVIAMSVGLNEARGDQIAITSADQFPALARANALSSIAPPVPTAEAMATNKDADRHADTGQGVTEPNLTAPALWSDHTLRIGAALAAVLVVALALLALLARLLRPTETAAPLTAEERARVLERVNAWLQADALAAGRGERS